MTENIINAATILHNISQKNNRDDIKQSIKFNENIKNIVDDIDIGGQFGSGAEQKILPLFCDGTKRIHEKLYDFVQPNGLKIELKKMENCQWFDICKYHDLTKDDKNIIMLFILHKKGKIDDNLYSITLGEFLDICCNDEEYNEYGWDWENIKIQHMQREKHKRMQTKIPLYLRKFIKKYNDRLEIFNVR